MSPSGCGPRPRSPRSRTAPPRSHPSLRSSHLRFLPGSCSGWNGRSLLTVGPGCTPRPPPRSRRVPTSTRAGPPTPCDEKGVRLETATGPRYRMVSGLLRRSLAALVAEDRADHRRGPLQLAVVRVEQGVELTRCPKKDRLPMRRALRYYAGKGWGGSGVGCGSSRVRRPGSTGPY
jgi:hypothetical protein